MKTAQLNIRLDPALKSRGDKTLARSGITPTQAVRSVWRYLAETGTVPECIADEAGGSQPKRSPQTANESGLALRLAHEKGLIADDDVAEAQTASFEELRELAREEWARERGFDHV